MSDKSDIEELRAALRRDASYKNPRASTQQFRPVTPQSQYKPQYRPLDKQDQKKNHGKSETRTLIQWAIQMYEWIDEFFKAFGIVMGGIATSLADWVLGAVTMTIMLSGYSGMTGTMKFVTGAIFSVALWGIQIILWRLVFTGRIKNIAKENNTIRLWLYILVFVGIILMKFGDDFTDVIGVFWMIKDNPIQLGLSPTVYGPLQNTILFLAWCICGFAEVFVALSIGLLKDDQKN